jgi:hypothetical protein
MTNIFFNIMSQDYGSLGDLNAQRKRTKARLASAWLAGDQEAQASAAADLTDLDEAIGTILATLALRNAEVARHRQAAA